MVRETEERVQGDSGESVWLRKRPRCWKDPGRGDPRSSGTAFKTYQGEVCIKYGQHMGIWKGYFI